MKEFLQKSGGFCFDSRKGIAIYFSIAVLSIVLAIALGVSALSVSRIRMLNEAGNSVVAFAAAETGIEWALYEIYNNDLGPGYIGSTNLENGADYELSTYACGASNELLCVKSIGKYRNSQRTILIRQ